GDGCFRIFDDEVRVAKDRNRVEFTHGRSLDVAEIAEAFDGRFGRIGKSNERCIYRLRGKTFHTFVLSKRHECFLGSSSLWLVEFEKIYKHPFAATHFLRKRYSERFCALFFRDRASKDFVFIRSVRDAPPAPYGRTPRARARAASALLLPRLFATATNFTAT